MNIYKTPYFTPLHSGGGHALMLSRHPSPVPPNTSNAPRAPLLYLHTDFLPAFYPSFPTPPLKTKAENPSLPGLVEDFKLLQ